MSNITVISHPLITHKISVLRSIETSCKEFRELVEEIAMLMGYESLRDLPLEDVAIETPICKTTTKCFQEKSWQLCPFCVRDSVW